LEGITLAARWLSELPACWHIRCMLLPLFHFNNILCLLKDQITLAQLHDKKKGCKEEKAVGCKL